MTATPERIAFVLQPFRRARIEDADVRALYGKDARESPDPVPTFFDSVEDAALVAAERMNLLATPRRRFNLRVLGLDDLLEQDFAGAEVPTAEFTDEEKGAALRTALTGIAFDFNRQQARLSVWG